MEKFIHALVQFADHLVAANHRLNELGVVLDVLQKLRDVFLEAEEIALLGKASQGPAADRRLVCLGLGLGFRNEFLLPLVVPAFVTGEVNVVVFQQPANDLLHRGFVPGLGRADKIIVADADFLPESLEDRDHCVGKDVRLDILSGRGFDDLDPVLIGAGEKKRLPAIQAVEAGHGIRGDRGVRMAEVRLAVGIVNRRRDVKRLGHGENLSIERQQKNHRPIRLKTLAHGIDSLGADPSAAIPIASPSIGSNDGS